jgi:ABC-2 type transport system permease protein
MTAFTALVRKDIRLFFSDRRAVLMCLVSPIVIGSFFGFIMGGQGSKPDAGRISVLVADEDGSAVSHSITARLAAEKSLEVKSAPLPEARERVRKGKAAVAFVIPKDFGKDSGRAFFSTAAKPGIRMLFDPSHGAEAGMAQGILTGSVMQAVSKEMFSGDSGRDLARESLGRLDDAKDMPPKAKESLRSLLHSVDDWNAQSKSAGQAGESGLGQGLSMPFTTHSEAVTSSEGVPYNGYAHAFGGMSVQFVLFLGIDVGIALLLQRQRGLWKRLRAAPLSRATLLGSRGVSAALISMFILMVVFAFARVAFHVKIAGSFAGFICICAAFSLLTSMFGLLIAALGTTPEATRGIAIMTTLVMVMLGGGWMPMFLFPQWLQKATWLIPTRWAMDGLDASIWRGVGFAGVVPQIALLTGGAVLFGALAVARFRWEEKG